MQILSKIGLLLVLLTPAVAFWVVEPYGNNPMGEPPLPTIELAKTSKCDFLSGSVDERSQPHRRYPVLNFLRNFFLFLIVVLASIRLNVALTLRLGA